MRFEHFEEATHACVNARRNYLMALWAGKQIGLSGDGLQRYAVEVHEADTGAAGPAVIVQKIQQDLTQANVFVAADAVMETLKRSESTARCEILSTD